MSIIIASVNTTVVGRWKQKHQICTHSHHSLVVVLPALDLCTTNVVVARIYRCLPTSGILPPSRIIRCFTDHNVICTLGCCIVVCRWYQNLIQEHEAQKQNVSQKEGGLQSLREQNDQLQELCGSTANSYTTVTMEVSKVCVIWLYEMFLLPRSLFTVIIFAWLAAYVYSYCIFVLLKP